MIILWIYVYHFHSITHMNSPNSSGQEETIQMALTGDGHLGCPGEVDEMVESRKHFYELAWKLFARSEEISSHDFRRKTMLSLRLHLRANWLLENFTSRAKLQCKKIKVLFGDFFNFLREFGTKAPKCQLPPAFWGIWPEMQCRATQSWNIVAVLSSRRCMLFSFLL